MDRVLGSVVLGLVVAAGCTAPPKLVQPGAVLAGVAADQSSVALLFDSAVTNGFRVGKMAVLVAGSAAPLMLNGAALAGGYRRGTALFFLGDVEILQETLSDGTVVTHPWGGLYAWTPGMSAAAKIGANVLGSDVVVAANGGAVAFYDWAKRATLDLTNTATLLVANAASCARDLCKPISVAGSTPQFRLSRDGQWVLATARPLVAGDTTVLLVGTQYGDVHPLSTAPARSPMIAPGGDVAAWVERANHIVSRSLPSMAPRADLVSDAPVIESATMMDGSTFVAKTCDPNCMATVPHTNALARVSTNGNAALPIANPIEAVIFEDAPGQTDHFLFFRNEPATLGVLDLSSRRLLPVTLGSAHIAPIAATGIYFSDDGSLVHFYHQGQDYLYKLGAATPPMFPVATTTSFGAFVPSTSGFLYVDAPDADSGAGVLTLLPSIGGAERIQNIGVYNFVSARGPDKRTYYTALAGRSDDGVWSEPSP